MHISKTYTVLARSVILITFFACSFMPPSFAQAIESSEDSIATNIIDPHSSAEKTVEWRIPDEQKFEDYRKDSRFKYDPQEKVKAEDTSWLGRALERLFRYLATIFELEHKFGVLGWILVIVVAVIIVVVIAKLLKLDIRNLIGKKKGREEIDIYTENVHDMHFDDLIMSALNEGDYRLAVRYLYLRNLKLLSDKSMISWAVNKTNYNYLREIRDSQIREKFQYMTNIFDYVWYGEFPVDAEGYETIRGHMHELQNMIGYEA